MEFQFPVESSVNIQQYEFIPIETQPPLHELLGNSYETLPSHYSGPGLSGRGWSFEHQGPIRSAATKSLAKRKRT